MLRKVAKMERKKIKYIAFYAINDNENRQVSLSAKNKIDYICSSLVRNSYDVEIISPSWTKNEKGFYKGDKLEINDHITMKDFFSFGARNKIGRWLRYGISLFQLFLFLAFKAKKDEQIIVYHSVILSLPIRAAQFIKKFKIILEVEEVYQDAQNLSEFMKASEYKIFKTADKFLFSTELLNRKINPERKPNIAIYGTYQLEKEIGVKFDDGKIHLVYAGTFDSRKGGAITAINAAKYLTEKYHLHIIGFGSKKDTEEVENRILEMSEYSKAIISYDGLLKGQEYTCFLQKCHIGLSTQLPTSDYNETSFPSKILSYMANGLKVISVDIEVVKNSSISKYVYFYEGQNGLKIAESIKSINLNKNYNSREIIEQLDNKFTSKLKRLLEC